jgi:FkbM family methyltransferase
MQEQLRSFIRRHRLLRVAARQYRRVVPRPAPELPSIDLRLPQLQGDLQQGPESVTVRADGKHTLFKRLKREGIGGYEPETLACFLAALEEAPDGAVLDVGANLGLYSIVASARSRRRVYGFEPTPDLATVMRRVAADNDLGFHTEQLAMGRESGTAKLYLSDRADLSNSLVEGFRESHTQVDVPLETADAWCARTGVIPGLIKIDTEATEPAVVEGALDTIQAHRPWIFCEVLYGRVEEPIMELMRPHGYYWYHLAGDPPYQPQDQIVGDNTYQCLMWLLTPEPVDDKFWARAAEWRSSVDKLKVPT